MNSKYSRPLPMRVLTVAAALLLTVTTAVSVAGAPNETLKEKYNVQLPDTNLDATGVDPTTKYSYVSQSYAGIPGAAKKIELPAGAAVRSDGEAVPLEQVEGLSGGAAVTKEAIVWDDRCESYSWQIEVPEDALYEISLCYMTMHDDTVQAMRHIYIDGKEPFYEARNILLSRSFYESEEATLDSSGDEVTPRLEQDNIWQTEPVRDMNGYYEMPLQFLLTEGTHTLSVVYSTCNIYLAGVALTPLTEVPDYQTYYASHEETFGTKPLYIEAETADIRSVPALRRGTDGSPRVSPFKPGYILKNMIGGWYWRKPHESLTYVIDVEEEGYYRLCLNVSQEARYAASVYRQIRIDGEIPFEEVAAYKFEYNGGEYTPVVIGEDEDTPYYFYFTEGRHELTFSVVLGDFSEYIEASYALVDKMTQQYREIVTVTGISPDVNYDYELEEKIPDTVAAMRQDVEELRALVDMAVALSGETTSSSSLSAQIEELEGIVADPENIPSKLTNFLTIQSSISDFASEVAVAPLGLDYIQLLGADDPVPEPTGSFWDSIVAFCMEFIRSFTRDYDANSNTGELSEDELEVWIANSREYGELLQRLCDDDFTRQTGIKVKVNILPSGSVSATGLSPLMLTIVSGDQPDVVVGSDSGSPVELAIRDAVVDLTEFEQYEEITSRFLPGAIECFEYNGGVYAFPMTMDFPLLFYRTDIFSQLALTVPDTWDELTQNTFPSMKQSQYSFYLSSSVSSSSNTTSALNYCMFLFQNGGELYSEDGLQSALNTDVAYRAFKQWTDLYLRFDIDIQADLLNHFRQGDIPLAVGTLYDYARIQFAAPELQGRWSIAAVPGTLQEDGTINRAAAGSVTANLMFDNGENRKEAAFAFLDWWTSSDVQKSYASEIEAIVGAESRWFSANVEAFQSLSWDQGHLDIMTEWFPNFRTIRNTLGGYLTARTLTNAWTETVINEKTAREQLEQAYKDTNAEMYRKQKEYGVTE